MAEKGSTISALAGYRVTRKLGVGSRANVYLGSGEGGSVALKVFHPSLDRDDIGRELDALGRLDSPHCVRLLDLASAEDHRPILVLGRVQRGSVAALLRDRESLEPGEVVTLVAPLAAALPAMHRAGVAHGRIGEGSVHLGDNGEPVLLGFGHSDVFASGGSIAAIDAEPAAARDREDLATLATQLLGRVRTAKDPRVVRLVEWIETSGREYEFVERLEARLFDFADPMPVRFPSADRSSSGVPARLDSTEVGRASTSAQLTESTSTPEGAPSVLARVDTLLRTSPVDALRRRAVTVIRSVRRPYWIAAGIVLVALIVALTALPQGAPSPQAATSPPASDAAIPTALALPADPVLALPLLLVARTACVRELSVLCLDTIDDQNSGAYGADASLIEQLQGGTEIPKTAVFAASAPRLVETLGNSAIVSLGPNSNPASVLMIKTEAGWRIRSYLRGVQATASPAPTG